MDFELCRLGTSFLMDFELWVCHFLCIKWYRDLILRPSNLGKGLVLCKNDVRWMSGGMALLVRAGEMNRRYWAIFATLLMFRKVPYTHRGYRSLHPGNKLMFSTSLKSLYAFTCIGLRYQEFVSMALCSCGWLSEYKLNIMNELLYASQAQTENTTSPYIHLTYEF